LQLHQEQLIQVAAVEVVVDVLQQEDQEDQESLLLEHQELLEFQQVQELIQ
jgi:hypothetical protein